MCFASTPYSSFSAVDCIARAHLLVHQLSTSRTSPQPTNLTLFEVPSTGKSVDILYSMALSLLEESATALSAKHSDVRRGYEDFDFASKCVISAFQYLDRYHTKYNNLPSLTQSSNEIFTRTFGLNAHDLTLEAIRIENAGVGDGAGNSSRLSFLFMTEKKFPVFVASEHPLIEISSLLSSLAEISRSLSGRFGKPGESHCLVLHVEDTKYSLQKALAFAEHNLTEPMPAIAQPLPSTNMRDVVPAWYADFVSSADQDLLFGMINLSNLLGTEELLSLASATVASMIKGKTPERIRRAFNIANDLTPEEEAQRYAEDKWVEEL